MQDYKNNKILELVKEMVKVPNQTDYEINGVDTSRALFFYRKEKEKFKIIPRGSYSVVDVATNKYLRISDSVLLGEAIEFQVCYLFVKTSSSYVDPFPELERLQEHYNELYSDFNNLLQQLESNNIVGDTMKMAYVLPQLNEGQVWVLRQGEMKAEAIFDLDERLREAYENFTRVFDNWIQTEKKPEITQFVNEEKDRVFQEIETKKTQSIGEIDSHTTDKIQEIISEGILRKNQVTQEGDKQIELVTAEGNKQVQRVTETGNNQVANVENEGETQLNKILATGIDAKQDKKDPRISLDNKDVINAINTLLDGTTISGRLFSTSLALKTGNGQLLNVGDKDSSFLWNPLVGELQHLGDGNLSFVRKESEGKTSFTKNIQFTNDNGLITSEKHIVTVINSLVNSTEFLVTGAGVSEFNIKFGKLIIKGGRTRKGTHKFIEPFPNNILGGTACYDYRNPNTGTICSFESTDRTSFYADVSSESAYIRWVAIGY